MKIRAIIFSKDRPMQLECLLRSTRDNAPDLFDHIFIQFGCSNNDYLDAYKKIALEIFEWDQSPSKKSTTIPDNVSGGFKNTFCKLIKDSNDNYDYTCLLVDDDIIFNPIRRKHVEIFLKEFDILSLRLGDNIKNQVHHSYKGSLDGNIFKTEIVQKVLDKNFKNPNQLEVAMLDVCKPYSMSRFKDPKLIGIPANRVSDTSGCAFMEDNTQELLDKFKEGYRVDYKKMDFSCSDVHKYVPFEFFKP